MKTSQTNQVIYLVSMIILCSAWFIVGCNNNTQENKLTEEQVIAYQDSLRQDSILRMSKIHEWNTFKASTEIVLSNNQEKIDALRLKIRKSNTPNLDKLRQKRIEELQYENQQIKERLVQLEIKKQEVLLDNEIAAIKAQLNSIEAKLKEIS